MELLAGKTGVVTGGSSGIGRAIAIAFARHGADVVVADVQDEPREGDVPTHEFIRTETDADSSFVRCDVTDNDDIERAIDAAEEFGGIDVMVNNAGILGDESFPNTSEATYRRIMDVNVKGVYFGSQIASRRLVERGGGAIVNMSSTAGLKGDADHPIYNASKAAVRIMTYSLAEELGPDGVRVNAIHPGFIDTEMNVEDFPILGTEREEEARLNIPVRRVGRPAEVADAALFLASDLASFVNASSIVVDGGSTYTG
jgi:NAD(P)-dependent dehydrogenase (short-subunit alcohol dehydrogenase family)